MIKSLIMFIFGNALWDKLVDYFGSPEAVIGALFAAVAVALVAYIIKKIVEILIGLSIIFFILAVIFG